MAHELKLLTKKLNNTPHLIDPVSFQGIVDYLSDRNVGEMVIDSKSKKKEDKYLNYNPDTKAGVISVEGPLTYKSTGWEALCGGCSYESVVEQFNSMVDMGAKTVILWADSGGGEAYGMMETGRYMRKRANEAGVKILTYVDGISASACYGITCIADEVIANPNAEVGSIGVVVRLMNDSKALEQKGYERTFVYAGGNKVPFNAGGEFREEFLSDIQSKVDALYEEFTGYVSEMRGVSVDQVKSTEAKVFMAKDSVSLGLVDKLMTHEEFMDYQADFSNKETNMLSKTNLFGMKAEDNLSEVEMSKLEELQAQHSELEAKFNEQGAELQAQVEKVASLSAELSQVQEQLQAALEEKQALEASAEEQKVNTRKEAIKAVEGDVEKQAALFEATASLSDAAFETIVSSMKAKEEKLEESDLFTQKSKQMEVEEPKDENPTATLLKTKYQPKQ